MCAFGISNIPMVSKVGTVFISRAGS